MSPVRISLLMGALCVLWPLAARAELDLGLGGYMLNYGVYTAQDEPPSSDLRHFDFRKETRIEMRGSTELENGLTVGATALLYVDRPDTARMMDRSYITVSGNLGQINFGENYGVPALLQVEAPSADAYVDGMDPKINALDISDLGGGTAPDLLDYYQNTTGKLTKLTYMTPVVGGFQAGLSYTPSVSDASGLASGDAAAPANELGELGNAIEGAVRYEWKKGVWRTVLGGGISRLNAESKDSVTSHAGSDDQLSYNISGVVGYDRWSLGAAWLSDNNAIAANGDTDIGVVGLGYKVSEAAQLGLSYYGRRDEAAATATADTTHIDRITFGGSYEYAPGFSLRASLAHLRLETGGEESQGSQLALGSKIAF